MDDGERLIQQAAKVKEVNPKTHVWVYRNLVKALSWYKDVGEKLADPAYSGWFLHFAPGGAKDLGSNKTWHSPPCTAGACSALFHSQDQTPRAAECAGGKCECGGAPCGEYLWDHRNASLREWLIVRFPPIFTPFHSISLHFCSSFYAIILLCASLLSQEEHVMGALGMGNGAIFC